MEKKELSIYELQQLIEGKKALEVGKILSGEKAGSWCGIWYDWFCSDKALPREASRFATYIKGLKGEWTKTHGVWLKNNCPMAGPLYTDIRISPLADDVPHYNVGYSLGNGASRQREIFDTRKSKDNGGCMEYLVKNNKEAYEKVNELMEGVK